MGDKSYTCPDTLLEFGYGFNEHGQLRRIEKKTGLLTDAPYEFQVSSNHAKNQERYEALGDAITEYVYQLLETEGGLKRLAVPKDASEPCSFIFASDDVFTNEKKLMILIHGSGVVRAGQWARSLIINDSLKTGSQLPYIKRAKEEGYAVLVMNTNDNMRLVNGKFVSVKGSEDPGSHACTVWKEYVVPEVKAQEIVIVAHSYGGVATLSLADEHRDTFQARVKAVAMTDSVHDFGQQKTSKVCKEFLKEVGRNWVVSDEPVDVPVDGDEDDIPCVSAGHEKHVMTSATSMDSIFKFFQQRLSSLSHL